MSRYAVDTDRRALVVSWPTGIGDVASTVSRLPSSGEEEDTRELADALTTLSAALWRTYTHPASAVGTPETNGEVWRREQERDAFDQVVPALHKPYLPDGGYLVQPYSPIAANAHRVGRALHALADDSLRSLVVADLEREMEAVRDAELGSLTGRASQAVALTRSDASPVQVVAADALLAEDPLGSTALFSDLDPAAASIAASHWLQAAATVTSRVSGLVPEAIVVEADNLEALPHQTPTLVLELLGDGETPRDVVLALIHDAMAVARGLMPDLDTIEGVVEEARAIVEKFDVDPAELEPRLTPLDPARPAVDLLEDLLSGIHGCWLIYQEHSYDDAIDLDDERDGEGDSGADEVTLQEFCDAVRAEAASTRDRLN